MRALGVPLAQAVRACAGLLPVPGRMERLSEPGKPLVAVDYAHTPDALDKALAGAARRWRSSAAASCGACSAAAATATRPSAR